MKIPGFNEWSPSEIKTKDEAIAGVLFSDLDAVFDAENLAETSYETAAVNQILAWLDFPYQQRAYLDCLVALAAGCGRDSFTATNVEIARQLRTGQNSRDESLAKWVTRQKKKFQLWQSVKQFNLVEITDGHFDPKKQKNTPATYRLLLTEWAQKAVALAKARQKTIWRKSHAYRRVQLRAIRRAVYDLLQSIPECPPLKLKIRTLSVEDNFDRRAHSIFSFAEMNKEDLHRIGLVPDDFIDYLIRGLEKIKRKPAGALGNLLTPENKEVDKKAKVWQAIMQGQISDLMTDDEVIDYTGSAVDGEFTSETSFNRTDTRADTESDNHQNSSSIPCNSLNPLSDGRTFCDYEDGSNGVVKAAFQTVKETHSAIEKEQAQKKAAELVAHWFKQARDEYPPPDLSGRNAGSWEIVWESYTSDARGTREALNAAVEESSLHHDQDAALEGLRQTMLDYLIARARFWIRDMPTPGDHTKMNRFRLELGELLTMPADSSP